MRQLVVSVSIITHELFRSFLRQTDK